jgi:hypothetical protein
VFVVEQLIDDKGKLAERPADAAFDLVLAC